MESYALIYLMVCEFELWDWWQPSFDTYGGILSRLTYDMIIIEFCKQKNKQDPNCGSSESFVWILLMRLGCFLCKYCSGFCMSRVVSTWVCFWGLCEYFAVILLRRNEVVCIWVLLLMFGRFCVNIAFEVWPVLFIEYFTGFCMRPMHLWTERGQAAWDAVIS